MTQQYTTEEIKKFVGQLTEDDQTREVGALLEKQIVELERLGISKDSICDALMAMTVGYCLGHTDQDHTREWLLSIAEALEEQPDPGDGLSRVH